MFNNMYTIKSESPEGTYYLVKDWRKNKKLWVKWEQVRKDYLFKKPESAKASFTQLLKAMPEYAEDTITLVTLPVIENMVFPEV